MQNTQSNHTCCHTCTYYHRKNNIWQSITYWNKFSQWSSTAHIVVFYVCTFWWKL